MTLKQGDMIEISMTIESEGKVFDTTNSELAKQEGLQGTGNKKIVFGKNMLLPKVEEKLKDAKEGEEFTLELGVEDAFGRKKKEFYQTYPEKVFKEKNLRIQTGQVYNFDGNYGKVKSASRGRVMVDFNHPLAGKDVTFKFSLQKVLTDIKDKVETTLNVLIGLSEEMYKIKVEDKTITLNVPEQLAQMSDMLKGALSEQLGDEIKEYTIEIKKLENKK
ncbi:MAG: peptidylprolyl isomerase [Candidatus Nanoarchaeia archaeon]